MNGIPKDSACYKIHHELMGGICVNMKDNERQVASSSGNDTKIPATKKFSFFYPPPVSE